MDSIKKILKVGGLTDIVGKNKHRKFEAAKIKSEGDIEKVDFERINLLIIPPEPKGTTVPNILKAIQRHPKASLIPTLVHTNELLAESQGFKYIPIVDAEPTNQIENVLTSNGKLDSTENKDEQISEVLSNILANVANKQRKIKLRTLIVIKKTAPVKRHFFADRGQTFTDNSIFSQLKRAGRFSRPKTVIKNSFQEPEKAEKPAQSKPKKKKVTKSVQPKKEKPVTKKAKKDDQPKKEKAKPVAKKAEKTVQPKKEKTTPIVKKSKGEAKPLAPVVNDKLNETKNEHVSTEEATLALLKDAIQLHDSTIPPKYKQSSDIAFYYPLMAKHFPDLSEDLHLEKLQSLCDYGFLQRKLVNKISLCPHCLNHQVNFRETCPYCQTIDIEIKPIYHHFSCGYMGVGSDFQAKGELDHICPKCDKKLRHIGLDYEKPSDTFHCNDCGSIFTESKIELECFNCGEVSEGPNVKIRNIYSFQATQRANLAIELDSITATISPTNNDSLRPHYYTKELFMFTLGERYASSLAFGDELILIISYVDAQPNARKKYRTFVSDMTHVTDFAYREDFNTSIIVTSRQKRGTIVEQLEEILDYGLALGPKLFTGGLLVREVPKEIKSLNSFVKETVEFFSKNKEKIMSEVAIFEN